MWDTRVRTEKIHVHEHFGLFYKIYKKETWNDTSTNIKKPEEIKLRCKTNLRIKQPYMRPYDLCVIMPTY